MHGPGVSIFLSVNDHAPLPFHASRLPLRLLGFFGPPENLRSDKPLDLVRDFDCVLQQGLSGSGMSGG